MKKTKIDLPIWFTGQVYESGDFVTNTFTGESIELSAEELSMHQFILLCQATGHYKLMRAVLEWFRRANLEKYRILFD